jgi:hypothetical protein
METEDENQAMMWQVLKKLKMHQLCSRPVKCELNNDQITFLGVTVRKGEVRMSQEKITKAMAWTKLHNKRDLWRFLGFTNTYQRFIQGYTKMAKPLHALTSNVPWNWDDKCNEAFERLKKAIGKAQVLVLLHEGRFQLETDGSEWATGAMRSQEQMDRRFKPINFNSHLMKSYERTTTPMTRSSSQ